MDLTIEPIEEPNEDLSERISDKPNEEPSECVGRGDAMTTTKKMTIPSEEPSKRVRVDAMIMTTKTTIPNEEPSERVGRGDVMSTTKKTTIPPLCVGRGDTATTRIKTTVPLICQSTFNWRMDLTIDPNEEPNKEPIKEPSERVSDKPNKESSERVWGGDAMTTTKPSVRVSDTVPPILNPMIKCDTMSETIIPPPLCVARANARSIDIYDDSNPTIKSNEEPSVSVSDTVPPILNRAIMRPNKELSKKPNKPPTKRFKGLFRRRKSIGRRKDGMQKKSGSYDFVGVRASHGLHSSARPQVVIQAVMANQDTTRQDGDVCAPLKSELQRDLKKAMASNSKYVASIESLKKKKKYNRILYHCKRRK